MTDTLDTVTAPPFPEAVRTWGYIGLNSFGGPAGQIAVMHRVVVDEKKWISEERFLHALNFCMLLPGPEAMQLATYIGWLMHGVRGGLAAGLLFVLPGALVMLGLSMVYATWQEMTLVQALFFGLKAAVLAIVVEAVQRIGKRALKDRFAYGVAAAAFIAIFLFQLPFPLIVLGAALIGWLRQHWANESGASPVNGADLGNGASWGHSLRVLIVWGGLWAAPLLALLILAGPYTTALEIGVFFSKAAVVTFGGAYAVLAYIAQQAVENYGWMQPGEMAEGLALAETTPGPLILVTQFVGFLAAYRDPGLLPPLLAGTLGAALTTWVTFVPCFLWIFLGAPYIEALRGNRSLSAALAAITAAVVGVILNLAVWFSLHTLFTESQPISLGPIQLDLPVFSSIDAAALVLSCAALIAVLRYHVGIFKVLVACAIAGAVWKLTIG